MGGQDKKPLADRIGQMEGDLDEIRLALWQISEKLDQLQPVRRSDTEPAEPAADQPVESLPITPAATPTPASASLTPSEQFSQPAAEPAAGKKPRTQRAKGYIPAKKPDGRRKKTVETPAFLLNAQFWFNLIGIVLVLLGVVFLYKYSVDQGWITAPMKVTFGMALGVILLGLGLFLHGRQRFFSQMLMGAGIATLYLSGFAAFQLYELIPYPAAIVWMGSVTLVAFILSVQQDEQVLALVGTIGGLLTPFLLHEGVSSRTDVVVYSCAVLCGSCAVYFYKGWRQLLWISVAGGWLTLLFIYTQNMPGYRGLSATDKKAMQAGIIFAVFAFWVLPLVREFFSSRNPARWPRPQVISAREEYERAKSVINRHVHALSISTPFIALFFTREIWHLTSREWGWVTLGAAAVWGLAFLALWTREGLRELAYTQMMVDLALFTMAISLILEGDSRFIAVTAEMVALQLVAWKLQDRIIFYIAHGFFLFLVLWLAERLIENHVRGTVIFNANALSELFLIVAAAGVSWLIAQKELRYIYQLASYVALLAWFLRELSELANGQGYVTVAWGACAVALLAAGILLNNNNWRIVSLVTLFVVVGKLLLVDLAMVKAIWRVLLFIGFGALFLVLSYFFQSLWKPGLKPGLKPGIKPPGESPA
ncbi:MAG: DUF2339 domain-containing protein [Thermoleophilia bacterium]